jgi:hypothetical protein
MRRKLITMITGLLCSVGYATDNSYYLLGNVGMGAGFSIIQEDQSTLLLSEKILGGISFQTPYRWDTAFMVTAAYHGWLDVPVNHTSIIKSMYPTLSIEAAIKKPFLKVDIGDSIPLQVYARVGLWGAGTAIKYFHENEPVLPSGAGPLGGLGFQIELLPRLLVDVSLNGLLSSFTSMKNTWSGRIGIGWRLSD